ncbi:hypothetical protein OG216_40385 [Streptomycetaceae bacterium NBC_01309]
MSNLNEPDVAPATPTARAVADALTALGVYDRPPTDEELGAFADEEAAAYTLAILLFGTSVRAAGRTEKAAVGAGRLSGHLLAAARRQAVESIAPEDRGAALFLLASQLGNLAGDMARNGQLPENIAQDLQEVLPRFLKSLGEVMSPDATPSDPPPPRPPSAVS